MNMAFAPEKIFAGPLPETLEDLLPQSFYHKRLLSAVRIGNRRFDGLLDIGRNRKMLGRYEWVKPGTRSGLATVYYLGQDLIALGNFWLTERRKKGGENIEMLLDELVSIKEKAHQHREEKLVWERERARLQGVMEQKDRMIAVLGAGNKDADSVVPIHGPAYVFPQSVVMRPITGVYFLCRAERIMYVGQSENVLARVGDHTRTAAVAGRTFDSVRVIPVPKEKLLATENFYIKLVRPEWNTVGNCDGQKHYSHNLLVINEEEA